jgi:hypothetical protein
VLGVVAMNDTKTIFERAIVLKIVIFPASDRDRHFHIAKTSATFLL